MKRMRTTSRRVLRTTRGALFAVWASGALGCAGYAQSKIDLTTQAQKGVDLVRQSLIERQADSMKSAVALRKELDTAFDADVLSRDALTADWVIAHRKAYAIAIDAFDAQQSDILSADAATLANLDAITRVLLQLQQMHATELRYAGAGSLLGVKR